MATIKKPATKTTAKKAPAKKPAANKTTAKKTPVKKLGKIIFEFDGQQIDINLVGNSQNKLLRNLFNRITVTGQDSGISDFDTLTDFLDGRIGRTGIEANSADGTSFHAVIGSAEIGAVVLHEDLASGIGLFRADEDSDN